MPFCGREVASGGAAGEVLPGVHVHSPLDRVFESNDEQSAVWFEDGGGDDSGVRAEWVAEALARLDVPDIHGVVSTGDRQASSIRREADVVEVASRRLELRFRLLAAASIEKQHLAVLASKGNGARVRSDGQCLHRVAEAATEQPPTGAGVPGDDARAGLAASDGNQFASVATELQATAAVRHGKVCITFPVARSTTSTREFTLFVPWVWTASSLPSGLGAVSCTNSAKRKVCVARLVLRFQRVTWPLLPPSTTVWPSGRNDTASATDPSRAGNVSARWPVRRLTIASAPLLRVSANRSEFGLTASHGPAESPAQDRSGLFQLNARRGVACR